MKLLASLLLICFSINSFSQPSVEKQPAHVWKPLFYLDSVKMDNSQLLFNPQKIATVKVDNQFVDSARMFQGRVFITSKNPADFNFLTLPTIAHKNQADTLKPTVFLIDNKIVKDISQMKIDSSYVLKVEITSGAEIAYLNEAFKEMVIVRILTDNPENQPKIMIRGGETAAY